MVDLTSEGEFVLSVPHKTLYGRAVAPRCAVAGIGKPSIQRASG